MKKLIVTMILSLFISNLGLASSQELPKEELKIFKTSWDKNMVATAAFVNDHSIQDYENINEEELDEYCQDFDKEEFFSGDKCEPIMIAGGAVVCVVCIVVGHFGSQSWRESWKENDVKKFAEKTNKDAYELAEKWAQPAIDALGEHTTQAEMNKVFISTIRPFQLDALKKINEFKKKRYASYL